MAIRDRRRGVAFLGIFAILLQAALFGWHHHPVPLSSRGTPAVLAAGPSGHPTPALTDDDCQICFALSHHTASPVDFVAAPASAPVRPYLPAVDTAWFPLGSTYSFVPAPLLGFEVGLIRLIERRGSLAAQLQREEFNGERDTRGDALRRHDHFRGAGCSSGCRRRDRAGRPRRHRKRRPA